MSTIYGHTLADWVKMGHTAEEVAQALKGDPDATNRLIDTAMRKELAEKKSAPTGTYRKMAKPAYRGEVRLKVWRTLVPLTAKGQLKLWTQRVKDYWDRQAQTYGLRFAGYTVEEAEEDGILVVFSRAVVDEVLPGTRY